MDGADGFFDERVAASYDEDSPEMFAPSAVEPAVAFLADRAGDGPVLEFAVGTGRIALPLAERGLQVHGIELSEAMVARLRSKPGSDVIPVTIGDMATTVALGAGSFTVVFLVFNTIMNLTTQQEQVACFANAARHLAPGGVFVIEVLVPGLRRLPPGETFQVFDAGPDHWGLDEIDPATQHLISHHLVRVEGRFEHSAIPFRYVWPAELDLMAAMAGMTLRERWGGWSGEPFTGESARHVSVWVRPAEG